MGSFRKKLKPHRKHRRLAKEDLMRADFPALEANLPFHKSTQCLTLSITGRRSLIQTIESLTD